MCYHKVITAALFLNFCLALVVFFCIAACLVMCWCSLSNIMLLCGVLYPTFHGVMVVVRVELERQWLPNTSWVTFPKYLEEEQKCR